MEAVSLRKRMHELSLRAAQLQGVLAADRSLAAELTRDVALAKGRNDLSEEIGRVFDALQNKAHQRSVGAFENLLSAVLNDVLPDEGVVKLLTEYKNNSTYLDFALEKNGGLEDVLDGNGGAVTNVICAGLRYAALSRTANRRLMVLDEPDCWLKPERVPFFVNVISQVSRDMQTQTFFITHHDTAFFEGKVNLVRFFADDENTVHAQALAPLAQDWTSPQEKGIRAIELFNVRRHEHTMVPCFPGATAYIGDNNLGKSTAIVTALKVVAYGESDDSMIRHGCTEAKIVIYLEDDQRLEWTRNTKRSPAVMFKLYKGTELVTEGRPKTRNQAPEWVSDVLGVTRVDELDLQIGSQKSPVFLLNDPAPRRAQILSVGRESSHLRSFMKLYDELKAKDRDVIRAGELTLARLSAKLTYLVRIEPWAADLATHTAKGELLLTGLEEREALTKLSARVEAAELSVQTLQLQADVLARVPQAPQLFDVETLAGLAVRVSNGTAAANASAVPTLPVVPSLAENSALEAVTCKIAAAPVFAELTPVPVLPKVPDLAEVLGLAQLGCRIGAATAVIAVPVALPPPLAPTLLELATLEAALAELVKRQATAASAQAESHGSQVALVAAQEELLLTQDLLGGECPLCGSPFATTNQDHAEGHTHVHH